MSTLHGTAPTTEQIWEAANNIGHCLAEIPYAIVGGAACTLLGSTRVTEDIDIVVPQGATKATRQLLRADSSHFEVDRKTLHTRYKSDPTVEIEILAPPALFREPFTAETPTVSVGNVKVLKPTLLLNAKLNSITSRATEEKKNDDATDIIFWLKWCAQNDYRPTVEEVPAATGEFFEWFINVYGGENDWLIAGFDVQIG